MTSIIDVALSGMYAASSQIAASSNNIVNNQSSVNSLQSSSTGPVLPQDVVILSQKSGGVTTSLKTSALFEADEESSDGFGILPKIETTKEFAKIEDARALFNSSLNLLETHKNMEKSLLDVFV